MEMKKTVKCLVVSDNHQDETVLTDLLTLYEETVDIFVHCGDSELHSSHPVWKKMQTVEGNMDFSGLYPKDYLFEFGDKKAWVTHGHLYDVKTSMTKLKVKAKKIGANIVLFGHTHVQWVEEQEGVVLLNPGSISIPKGDSPLKTYAIIELSNDQLMVHYYNQNHQLVEKWSKTFHLN